LAFLLAAATLLVIANAYPIVGLEIQGTSNATTLFGAVHALWNQDKQPIAVLVLLTTFLVPAAELAVMGYLLLSLKLGRIPAGLTVIMRILQGVNPWGMVEVFILGVIVALVKLTHYGSIIPGLALWSFGLLTLLLAATASSFDMRDIWDRAYPAHRREVSK
jgi:paraquat-inducible protein A